MIIRDPYTTLAPYNAGPPFSALGAQPGATDQALLRELHGLAMAIYQGQQDAIQFSKTGKPDLARLRVLDVARLRDIFAATAEQFRGNDPTLSEGGFSSVLLTLGSWIESALEALPGIIAFIPKTIIKAVGLIGKEAGKAVWDVGLPVLAFGAIALIFLMQAEKSRTVRRYVA